MACSSLLEGFQVVLMVKNLPANEGDTRDVGLIPGLGKSPGGGNGISLRYSCMENWVLEYLGWDFFKEHYRDMEWLKPVNYKQWFLIYWWDFWVGRGSRRDLKSRHNWEWTEDRMILPHLYMYQDVLSHSLKINLFKNTSELKDSRIEALLSS